MAAGKHSPVQKQSVETKNGPQMLDVIDPDDPNAIARAMGFGGFDTSKVFFLFTTLLKSKHDRDGKLLEMMSGPWTRKRPPNIDRCCIEGSSMKCL